MTTDAMFAAVGRLQLSAAAYVEFYFIICEFADLKAELTRYRWQQARDAYLWN